VFHLLLALIVDYTQVIFTPSTTKSFRLNNYKSEIGKPYGKLAFFLCLKSDYDEFECSTGEGEADLISGDEKFTLIRCKSLKSILKLVALSPLLLPLLEMMLVMEMTP